MSFEVLSSDGYGGKPSFKWFGDEPEIGSIAQLDVNGNEVVATTSNGRCPLGIVKNYFHIKGITHIEVEEKRGFYKSTCYDPKQRYPVNAILFVKDGMLTTKRDEKEENPGVAFVVNPPMALDERLTFLWM